MKLVNSYFQDRENRTRIQDTTSSWKPMRRGCPHGLSLGPLLWNVFQNDLFYLDRELQLSTFADDHQIHSSGFQPEIAGKSVKHDGTATSEWYESNLLEGNLSKYQVMTMGKQDYSTTSDFNIGNNNIVKTEKLKLVGVTIDRCLNVSEHISAISEKVSKQIGVVMRLRKLIPEQAKLQIYKAAVLPHLTYCSLVWHFCKGSDQQTLERLNHRGLRAVFCDWTSHMKNCSSEPE